MIVATQMLHNMIKYPRPTRAEVTDIANAIYYRTDALMLSGETAYGLYPLESVQTMAKIAIEAEKSKLSANDIRIPNSDDDVDVTAFLSKQAVKSATKINTKAIITDSFSGRTARSLAAFRGRLPIYAQCYSRRTARELSLSYGIFPKYRPEAKNAREYLKRSIATLIKQKFIKDDDLVAYMGGSYGIGQGTTSLEICEAKKFNM